MTEADKSGTQRVAEADVDAFRKHLGPFVVAAETTRMAMIFTNAKELENPIVFANNSFLTLTGFNREEVLAKDFGSLLASDATPEVFAAVKAAFDGTATTEQKINFRRKFGDEFSTSLLVSPVRNELGEIVQHFISFVDLTHQKEEQTHTDLLINELNHRVKNTLATVQSIVSQSLRNSSDLSIIRESIESRLFALSCSHDLLTRENWKNASLIDVVQEATAPFGSTDGQVDRFKITGPNVKFAPKAVLALSIALHELATNAVKYGAFTTSVGFVEISWTVVSVEKSERLLLHWREKDGPVVAAPSRRGFGLRVIERGLAHELKGDVKVDFHPDGVTCTMNIPAPRATHNE